MGFIFFFIISSFAFNIDIFYPRRSFFPCVTHVLSFFFKKKEKRKKQKTKKQKKGQCLLPWMPDGSGQGIAGYIQPGQASLFFFFFFFCTFRAVFSASCCTEFLRTFLPFQRCHCIFGIVWVVPFTMPVSISLTRCMCPCSSTLLSM